LSTDLESSKGNDSGTKNLTSGMMTSCDANIIGNRENRE